MKDNTKLRQYNPFRLNECDSMREYFEEMALKGWKLTSVKVLLHFEKIEPRKLHYSVEVFPNIPHYDDGLEESTMEYVEHCRAAGWDYVCHKRQIIIFESEAENPVPIKTDEALKLKTISKGVFGLYAGTWLGVLPVTLAQLPLHFGNLSSLVNVLTSGRIVSSSQTFLAGTTTYRVVLEDGEKDEFTVFSSGYDSILDLYFHSEMRQRSYEKFEEIIAPEWGAKKVLQSDYHMYLVYQTYIVSFNYSLSFPSNITPAIIDRAMA